MYYQQRKVKVQAYQLTRDVRMDAPAWLMDEVDAGRADIDEALNDGSVRVYGCTIRTPQGRMKAKPGDYIIREPDGSLNVRKGSTFKNFYAEVS